ncbi:MAG: 3-dehydroquinate synthase [Christensenellaceae bacterium]|nr:3-dehydroquinate synthase [Christensenellaceae bacterium]
MKKVTVNGSKTYDIIIDRGLMNQVGKTAAEIVPVGKCCVITDDTVDGFFGESVIKSLSEAGFTPIKIVIPHGEGSKNGDQFLRIMSILAQEKITRSDTIFALGGGVVGDLAGFAASCYMRGIHLVQIPTTLLAMVDSSVGGKTAIDLPEGKNLVGAFYQPDLVICDLDAAESLPKDVIADGTAEIIKYGMICDEGLLVLLEKPIAENLEEIVSRCVSIKRDIVNADERDTGIRQLLNLGHTPAHGIEKLSGYTIPHGNAVAIGMAMITRAASPQISEKLERLIVKHGLPTETDFSSEELIDAALSDKKRTGDSITLVIPEAYGKSVLRKMKIDEIAPYFQKTKRDL